MNTRWLIVLAMAFLALNMVMGVSAQDVNVQDIVVQDITDITVNDEPIRTDWSDFGLDCPPTLNGYTGIYASGFGSDDVIELPQGLSYQVLAIDLDPNLHLVLTSQPANYSFAESEVSGTVSIRLSQPAWISVYYNGLYQTCPVDVDQTHVFVEPGDIYALSARDNFVLEGESSFGIIFLSAEYVPFTGSGHIGFLAGKHQMMLEVYQPAFVLVVPLGPWCLTEIPVIDFKTQGGECPWGQ